MSVSGFMFPSVDNLQCLANNEILLIRQVSDQITLRVRASDEPN